QPPPENPVIAPASTSSRNARCIRTPDSRDNFRTEEDQEDLCSDCLVCASRCSPSPSHSLCVSFHCTEKTFCIFQRCRERMPLIWDWPSLIPPVARAQ